MKEVLSLMRLKVCLLLALACAGCGAASKASQGAGQARGSQSSAPRPSSGSPFLDKLVEAAIERTSHQIRYDQSYFTIDYPNGDVPSDVGVCTDEVIRSYRAVGVDLQRLVHEDMERAFDAYPHKWGLKKTATNIDHRRVPHPPEAARNLGHGFLLQVRCPWLAAGITSARAIRMTVGRQHLCRR